MRVLVLALCLVLVTIAAPAAVAGSEDGVEVGVANRACISSAGTSVSITLAHCMPSRVPTLPPP